MNTDSTQIQETLNSVIIIGQKLNQNKDLIKGVPNEVLTAVATAVTAFFIRFFKIKRLKKKGVIDEFHKVKFFN